MTQDELTIRIADLEKEIARYPEGSISKKKVKEKNTTIIESLRTGRE